MPISKFETPAQFQELLEHAKSLWPMRNDLNPRTMREDAILGIMCELINNQTHLVLSAMKAGAVDWKEDQKQEKEQEKVYQDWFQAPAGPIKITSGSKEAFDWFKNLISEKIREKQKEVEHGCLVVTRDLGVDVSVRNRLLYAIAQLRGVDSVETYSALEARVSDGIYKKLLDSMNSKVW